MIVGWILENLFVAFVFDDELCFQLSLFCSTKYLLREMALEMEKGCGHMPQCKEPRFFASIVFLHFESQKTLEEVSFLVNSHYYVDYML